MKKLQSYRGARSGGRQRTRRAPSRGDRSPQLPGPLPQGAGPSSATLRPDPTHVCSRFPGHGWHGWPRHPGALGRRRPGSGRKVTRAAPLATAPGCGAGSHWAFGVRWGVFLFSFMQSVWLPGAL